MSAPQGRLEPGVAVSFIHLLEVRGRSLDIGAGVVVRLGNTVPGMQAGLAGRIGLVPRVVDRFLNFFGIGEINGKNLIKVAVDDGPWGQKQTFIAEIIGNAGDGAVGQHRKLGQPSADIEPVAIKAGQGQGVGNDHLLGKGAAALDDLKDEIQAFLIDDVGSAYAVNVERAGHAAHQPVGMRVFAAKDGVDVHHVLLEIQSFDIVGHNHQVGFGRELVGGVAPVAVGKDAKLVGIDELEQLVLDGFEVARRRVGPGRQFLRQFRGGLGIGGGGRNHVHPVQPRQMVQMHQVIMVHEAELHEVADDIGVIGDVNAEGVFNGLHGRQGMGARAHAADALGKGPGVTRVAAFKDNFYAAKDGAAGNGIGDDVVVIDVHLAAQVSLDAGHRIHNEAAARVNNSISLRIVFVGHGCVP